MRSTLLALVFVVTGVSALAQAPAPNVIDTKKFHATYRAAKGVEGALGVGVNRFRFQELLQALGTELAIAKDQVRTENERFLLGTYAQAAQLLAESGQRWDTERAQGLWQQALDRLAIANQLYQATPATIAVAIARAQRGLRELAAKEQAQADKAAMETAAAAAESANRRKAAQAEAAQQEKAYRELVARDESARARAAEQAREKERLEYARALRDPDAVSREMAARVLGERRGESAWAVPQLIEILMSDPSQDTRSGARAALRLIGTPEANRALSDEVARALEEPIGILKDQARTAFDRSFAAKKVAEIINKNPFASAEAVLSGFQALAETAASTEFSVASPSQQALVLLAGPGRAESVKLNCGATGTRDGCLGAIRPTRP